eukprot:403362192
MASLINQTTSPQSGMKQQNPNKLLKQSNNKFSEIKLPNIKANQTKKTINQNSKLNNDSNGSYGRRDFGANLKLRGNNEIGPAPGSYNIPSIFDKKRNSNPSFANSPRDQSYNRTFYGKPNVLQNPGPGTYFDHTPSPISPFKNSNSKQQSNYHFNFQDTTNSSFVNPPQYTLHSRTKFLDFFNHQNAHQSTTGQSFLPGPGPQSYTPRDGFLDQAGSFVNSKYKNEGNTKFMKVSQSLQGQRFPIISQKLQDQPSPQEYQVEKLTRTNAVGRYSDSKFKNSGAAKFSGISYQQTNQISNSNSFIKQ